MKLNKAQELAEQAIYEHTSSTKWQEVKYMKWTTSEMQDVIAKALVKNLSLFGVSQQRELLSWMKANYHLAKTEDQINELLLDYNFEQLNCC